MTDIWTAALEEAYASAPADDYIVHTLELIHPSFVDADDNSDSIRVALDERAWNLKYESWAPLFSGQTKTFEPLSMEVTLPSQGEANFGSLTMALDNVPRTIWPKLQAASRVRANAMVIYREWVATLNVSTGEYICTTPPDLIINQLTMKMVTATILRIEGTATFIDLLNKGFPRRRFDRENFPGLFGGA